VSGGIKRCNKCQTTYPSDAECMCPEIDRVLKKHSKVFEDLAKHDIGGIKHIEYNAPAVSTNTQSYLEYVPIKSLTLPTDSAERKEYPLFRGVLRYFPAALSGVARISKIGNDKHNPGEEMHHARGKSTDHGDCILRHLIDLQDLLARKDRHCLVGSDEILTEVSSLAWRALAYSQELHEQMGAPLAPGAKVENSDQS
jgi:hypothetical protein